MKLSPLTKENCEEARQWRNEHLVGLRTPFPLTKEQQEDFYRDVICNRNSPHKYWAIMAYGKFIGIGGVTNIQWENSIGEISIILSPNWRGKGNNGEQAVDLLLDQAFGYLNLKTICGECYHCNPAIKFWSKMAETFTGFVICDLPNRKYWQGKYYGSMYFSFDRDDFSKTHSLIQPA